MARQNKGVYVLECLPTSKTISQSTGALCLCACMRCARCEVCAHMCVVQESVAICVQSGAVTVAAEISLSLDR